MSRLDKLKQRGEKKARDLVPVGGAAQCATGPRPSGALAKRLGHASLTSEPHSKSQLDVKALRAKHQRPVDTGAPETAENLQQRYAPYSNWAQSKDGKIAIVVDATASMTSLLDATRASLAEIMRHAQEQAGGGLTIQLFVFRQYEEAQVVAQSDVSDDIAYLTDWLSNVSAEGGDGLSAIEAPLQRVLAAGDFDAVMLAGDVRSHTPEEVRRKAPAGTPTCHELAREFGRQKRPLYTFVVPTDDNNYTGQTIQDFRTLAELAHGESAMLDGSTAVRDMAVAVVLRHLAGARAVKQYLLANGAAMSRASQDFAERLALEHKP